MKTRPSIEKRRKEMLRQERNRAKADRRKTRRENPTKEPEFDEFGNEIVTPDGGDTPSGLSESGVPHPALSLANGPAERGEEEAREPAGVAGVKARS